MADKSAAAHIAQIKPLSTVKSDLSARTAHPSTSKMPKTHTRKITHAHTPEVGESLSYTRAAPTPCSEGAPCVPAW